MNVNPAPVYTTSLTGTPDFWVLSSDNVWCPVYAERERVTEGQYRTTYYAHHTTGVHVVAAARIVELCAEGRVSDNVPVDRGSERLKSIKGGGRSAADRWERLRRLLNARCAELSAATGYDHDDVRHGAAIEVSDGRTASSMRLDEDEMDDAVRFVEDQLDGAGFDIEASDAAYFARRQPSRLAA